MVRIASSIAHGAYYTCSPPYRSPLRECAPQVSVKLFSWSLPELILTEPEFASRAIDLVKDLMAPGKQEFVEPKFSTQAYYVRHTYFQALETIAGARATSRLLASQRHRMDVKLLSDDDELAADADC